MLVAEVGTSMGGFRDWIGKNRRQSWNVGDPAKKSWEAFRKHGTKQAGLFRKVPNPAHQRGNSFSQNPVQIAATLEEYGDH